MCEDDVAVKECADGTSVEWAEGRGRVLSWR